MIAKLVKHEAIKLFAQKYIYVLLALVVAVQVARTLATAFTPPETTLDIVTGPQLWAEGVGLGLRFGMYLLLVVGAMALSQEFSLGTVKTMLVLPIRRWQWVAAKLIFLALFSLSLLLTLAVVGFVLVALTLGWGDVMLGEVVRYAESAVWRQIGLATALTFFFLLPMCAFSLWIGSLFSSSGAAVGTGLLSLLVLEFAGGLAGYENYLFINSLHRPLAIIVKMGKGLNFQWGPLLTWGVGSSAVTLVALVAWVIWRIERMDITA